MTRPITPHRDLHDCSQAKWSVREIEDKKKQPKRLDQGSAVPLALTLIMAHPALIHYLRLGGAAPDVLAERTDPNFPSRALGPRTIIVSFVKLASLLASLTPMEAQ